MSLSSVINYDDTLQTSFIFHEQLAVVPDSVCSVQWELRNFRVNKWTAQFVTQSFPGSQTISTLGKSVPQFVGHRWTECVTIAILSLIRTSRNNKSNMLLQELNNNKK